MVVVSIGSPEIPEAALLKVVPTAEGEGVDDVLSNPRVRLVAIEPGL